MHPLNDERQQLPTEGCRRPTNRALCPRHVGTVLGGGKPEAGRYSSQSMSNRLSVFSGQPRAGNTGWAVFVNWGSTSRRNDYSAMSGIARNCCSCKRQMRRLPWNWELTPMRSTHPYTTRRTPGSRTSGSAASHVAVQASRATAANLTNGGAAQPRKPRLMPTSIGGWMM